MCSRLDDTQEGAPQQCDRSNYTNAIFCLDQPQHTVPGSHHANVDNHFGQIDEPIPLRIFGKVIINKASSSTCKGEDHSRSEIIAG
eukprot:c27472_g1_i1 orf=1-255(-)